MQLFYKFNTLYFIDSFCFEIYDFKKNRKHNLKQSSAIELKYKKININIKI